MAAPDAGHVTLPWRDAHVQVFSSRRRLSRRVAPPEPRQQRNVISLSFHHGELTATGGPCSVNARRHFGLWRRDCTRCGEANNMDE